MAVFTLRSEISRFWQSHNALARGQTTMTAGKQSESPRVETPMASRGTAICKRNGVEDAKLGEGIPWSAERKQKHGGHNQSSAHARKTELNCPQWSCKRGDGSRSRSVSARRGTSCHDVRGLPKESSDGLHETGLQLKDQSLSKGGSKVCAAHVATEGRVLRKRDWWDQRPDGNVEERLRKSRCEVHVANLPQAQGPGINRATELETKFHMLFHGLPDFHEKYLGSKQVVRNVDIKPGLKTFAFVELLDDVLASTAIAMNGFIWQGKSIAVSRPRGYVVPASGDALPLDVMPLRCEGILPTILQSSPVPTTTRSLYFGNLAVGVVDANHLAAELTPACKACAEYDSLMGEPITKIVMSSTGMHCFVHFQNEAIANQILAMFDGKFFHGRRLCVQRSLRAPRLELQNENELGIQLQLVPPVCMPGVANAGFQIV